MPPRFEYEIKDDPVRVAVAAERERCAKIAEQLVSGQALEINGETIPLGSMTMSPCDAQKATAIVIAAAIRNIK